MTPTAMTELIRLPEREAVQRHFDSGNWSVLRWAQVASTPGALAGLIVSLGAGRNSLALLWGVALLINLVLILGRRRAVVVRHARQVLLAYLAVHAVAAVFSMSIDEPAPAYVFAGYVFPTGLMFFRMRWYEYVGLELVFLGIAGWFVTPNAKGPDTGSLLGLAIGVAVYGLFATSVCFRLAGRSRERFLTDWRREVARDREEARMRGELLDAREIQLSMLPRRTPELEWLDSAGLSIPANEVGGDYYEYFQLDTERLVLVIGDVAGHGVASGLVLSGVRSGLYLLRDELARPVEVIDRLNRMVRETAPRRMFVTLQVALLDRRAGTVTVANAGHPPILHLRPGVRRGRPLGESGLPLGTGLEASYTEARGDLEEGDVLVFYTDGVIEAHNLAGREFGGERLMKEAEKAGTAAGAKAIRDALVGAISRFRGDAVQVDDLTLVVLKIGNLSPYTASGRSGRAAGLSGVP